MSIRQNIQTELDAMQNSGVVLYIDDRPASPEQIAAKCVREKMTYMADYVMADTGQLKEIRYDRVRGE